MGERQRTGTVNAASQNACMHSPALSDDAESFGVRPWGSTGDPARPPHPWGSGGGTAKRGQTCSRAAHGEAESQLLTSQSLRARLACRLPPAAAARRRGPCVHDASGAAPQGRGSPTPGNGMFHPKHHPGLEVLPHLCESSTSHMEETHGQGWIKQQE